MPRKKKSESEKLAEIIVQGIQEKKGKNIISMELSEIPNSVCNFFVICHGTSKVHVESIADSVEETTIKKLQSKPWHKEGFENAEWILLDFVDVVVHIFQEDTRSFYKLENLWADAKLKEYSSD
jgi:ribosome-associated protein